LSATGNVVVSDNLSVIGSTSFNGVTYGWPSADGSSGQFLKTDGSGILSWITSAGVTSNSIDFDEIVASASLDTNWDIALNSKNIDIGDGKFFINSSAASTSGNFEISGTASISSFTLPNTAGGTLGDCDAVGDTLNWDVTYGKFTCGTDEGAGSSAIKTEKSGTQVQAGANILNFDDGKFDLTSSGSTETIINLDWTSAGGPASLSQPEEVTGLWDFNAASTQFDFIELTGTASITVANTAFNINLGGNGDFNVLDAGTAVFTVNETNLITLNNEITDLTLINGLASVTSDLEVSGIASISAFTLPDKDGGLLADCDTAASSKLLWDSATGKFDCGTDSTGGGGTSTLQVRIGNPIGTDINPTATISFDANNFNITSSGSFDAVVKIDYDNGPASRTMAQIITGKWDFNAASTQFDFIELTGTASVTVANTAFNINLGGSGDFNVLDAGTAVFTVNETNLITLNNEITDRTLINGLASVTSDFEVSGTSSISAFSLVDKTGAAVADCE
ncbi:MAG: hypothetical protein Q7J73_01835, partial [Dehalococcoidales bacterium]|nr:hypothetical protein [Dehalococcoidales bacterium]